MQTVLALWIEGGKLFDRFLLTGRLPKVVRLVHAVVRDNIRRCFPAQFSNWLPADVGNALIGNDVT